jgi:16S rRNA (adenine1518-N6/adenine1519-N6)-dimethyltransferase
MHIPRKRFGQHFLHDQTIIQRIIQAVRPEPGQALVEIGPGLGALTVPLLTIVQVLDAVELDRDVVPILEERCAGLGQLQVHRADALHFDYCSLARGEGDLRVVGNLPYNISTPLLFHLAAQSHCIRDMHFMLQKEVVDRMAAQPGGGDYGRLSVMIQYHCKVTPLFNIGKGAFQPPPKVESSFVRLVPYAQPPVKVDSEHALAQVVTQAFGQRRKTLRNALKNLLDEQQIIDAGIDPKLRPERIDLKQFAELSNRLSALQDRNNALGQPRSRR